MKTRRPLFGKRFDWMLTKSPKVPPVPRPKSPCISPCIQPPDWQIGGGRPGAKDFWTPVTLREENMIASFLVLRSQTTLYISCHGNLTITNSGFCPAQEAHRILACQIPILITTKAVPSSFISQAGRQPRHPFLHRTITAGNLNSDSSLLGNVCYNPQND